jgi:hypothetical protein
MVLTEEKSLLHLSQVKTVNVPLYDEVSVLRLWPMMQSDAAFMMHFPNKMCKGRAPDRVYFFNILNTYQTNYLQQLIKHAHD